MIVGIGTDIIDVKRIKNIINKYGNKFKNRCFTTIEINKSERRSNSVHSYAKRYAAKEACSKALGTGLAKGIFWKDIEIYNDPSGKPSINLYNKGLNRINKLTNKRFSIQVSLSDEKEYAIANVIISKK